MTSSRGLDVGAVVVAVAFLGLGAMGRPMARRLVDADFEVSCFDVVGERVTELAAYGAVPATTARQAVEGCEVAVLMVATPDQATQVLFGSDGVAAVLDEGSTLVVTSTVGPDWMSQAAADLAARDVAVVDAPVSGGVARAGSGDLLVMASGAPRAVGRARPVLEALGSTIADCGEVPGRAQSVKLVNQLLCGVHIAVAAEAMGFATALGLDASEVFDVVRHGAAASFMLDDRGGRMLAGDFDDPKSALDIFVKDLGLVTDAAHSERFPALLASMAQQVFSMGASMGLGRLDDASVVRVYEQWAGDRVATTPGTEISPEVDAG